MGHCINNGTAVLFAYLEERKIIPDTVDKVGSQASEYGYILISTVLVILLIVSIYRLSGKKNQMEIPISE
jgi:hypothetical protein